MLKPCMSGIQKGAIIEPDHFTRYRLHDVHCLSVSVSYFIGSKVTEPSTHM